MGDTTIIKIALNKFYIFKENDLTVRFKALEEARVTDEGQTSGHVGGHVGDHVGKISKVSKSHNDTLEYKIINLIKQILLKTSPKAI